MGIRSRNRGGRARAGAADPDALESTIERALVKAVEQVGGRCVKLAGELAPGIPDRLCLFRGGKVVLVEVKRPKGGRLSPKQIDWGDWLTSSKHEYRVVKNEDEILDLIQDVRGAKES